MSDMTPDTETELEARCLSFLREAGRQPRDAVALGRALAPLVPTLREWILAKIGRKGGVPRCAQGRVAAEDVMSEVLCRLHEKPPGDQNLEGSAIARLRSWVNTVTCNILTDLKRAAASQKEQTCGEHDHIAAAPADQDCEPERVLTPDHPPLDLDCLVPLLPPDLVKGRPREVMLKDFENVRRDPPATDDLLGLELGLLPNNVQQARRRYLLKLWAWWAKAKEYYE